MESLRTIDRLRLAGALTAEDAAERRGIAADWLEAIDLVRLQPSVLSRAAEPLPVPLGTLDALHLASARAWRETFRTPLVMATHDAALALAARSFDFEVVGA